ncbi:MAG TPA: hypothetical protein VFG45_06020 [Candidatus Nitrosocosmicus sp.]|nr:hypothetical protein [Candidatus Nitrosocosmicus sp.]
MLFDNSKGLTAFGRHGCIMHGNNINEIVITITDLLHLICSQFTNDNYMLEGGDRVMRIINKISGDDISYVEIKEVTI